MNVYSTHDFMYLAIAIAVLWVGAFLSWALYQVGKLLSQVNETVSDARTKIKKIESALMTIKEKFEALSGYADMAAQAGKSLASYVGIGSEEKKNTRRVK